MDSSVDRRVPLHLKSFKTKQTLNPPGPKASREYDIELLFRWLHDGGVTRRAVIKLDGDTGVVEAHHVKQSSM